MKWPFPGRSRFAELRSASTARSGPIVVSWVPGDPPPRVAYAINKRVGTAVVRNRIRRRLKETVRRFLDLPGGIYLVRATPEAASMNFASLRSHLDQATTLVVRRARRSTPGQPGAGQA